MVSKAVTSPTSNQRLTLLRFKEQIETLFESLRAPMKVPLNYTQKVAQLEYIRKMHQEAVSAIQRYVRSAQTVLRSPDSSHSGLSFSRELSILIQQLAEYCAQLELDLEQPRTVQPTKTFNTRNDHLMRDDYVTSRTRPTPAPPIMDESTLNLQSFLMQKAQQMGLDKMEAPPEPSYVPPRPNHAPSRPDYASSRADYAPIQPNYEPKSSVYSTAGPNYLHPQSAYAPYYASDRLSERNHLEPQAPVSQQRKPVLSSTITKQAKKTPSQKVNESNRKDTRGVLHTEERRGESNRLRQTSTNKRKEASQKEEKPTYVRSVMRSPMQSTRASSIPRHLRYELGYGFQEEEEDIYEAKPYIAYSESLRKKMEEEERDAQALSLQQQIEREKELVEQAIHQEHHPTSRSEMNSQTEEVNEKRGEKKTTATDTQTEGPSRSPLILIREQHIRPLISHADSQTNPNDSVTEMTQTSETLPRTSSQYLSTEKTETGINTEKEVIQMYQRIQESAQPNDSAFHQLYRARMLTDEEIRKMSSQFLQQNRSAVRSNSSQLVDEIVDLILKDTVRHLSNIEVLRSGLQHATHSSQKKPETQKGDRVIIIDKSQIESHDRKFEQQKRRPREEKEKMKNKKHEEYDEIDKQLQMLTQSLHETEEQWKTARQPKKKEPQMFDDDIMELHDSITRDRAKRKEADIRQRLGFADALTEFILNQVITSVASEMSVVCDQFVGKVLTEEWTSQ
ncbi:hypothetical protein PROFUN_13354 [Planoprotostelium fungivorum]|uniref:Uncharacterized protein n=1 Tax=Planoprotostelium fungivorum TaxID=1890364 RepID=A0A2P6N427_9EUKA|nr:hypothetical protein PROFUN_13354 [Planoprotostelium fungivorum]